jgi:dihydrofolate reductase
MGKVVCSIVVSLDGYVAGPNQSLDNPLGEGGMQLHEWIFTTKSWRTMHGLEGGEDNQDSKVLAENFGGVGAVIMGRNMFDHGRGPWDESWRGWWGEEPPFHMPVFVLTHHARESLDMKGGTTFHFVTEGIEAALSQARAAAEDRDISIG